MKGNAVEPTTRAGREARSLRMLESVDVGTHGLDSYRGVAPDHLLDDLLQEAEALRGARVLHVNATPYGGGVSELLRSVVPLLADLGLEIREGFGLVVSETLWKGTPVVAGRAGGIPLQMADDIGGVLVEGVEECADAMLDLLTDRDRARALGEAGRDRVRERFLLPRLVLNHLQLMRQLVDREPLARDPDWSRRHDPVCGMALSEQPEATANHRGVEYGFCSEHCRFRFLDTPERYAQEP